MERVYHIAYSSAEFNRVLDSMRTANKPWGLAYRASLSDVTMNIIGDAVALPYRVLMVFER
jgi:hypothetical protein